MEKGGSFFSSHSLESRRDNVQKKARNKKEIASRNIEAIFIAWMDPSIESLVKLLDFD